MPAAGGAVRVVAVQVLVPEVEMVEPVARAVPRSTTTRALLRESAP